MDKNKREELLIRFDRFYINVRTKLDNYNRIRIFINLNTLTLCGFSLLILGFLGSTVPIIGNSLGWFAQPSWYDTYDKIFCDIILPILPLSALLLGGIHALSLIILPKNTDTSEISPKTTSDQYIKESLMPRFMRIFGSFKWEKTADSTAYRY